MSTETTTDPVSAWYAQRPAPRDPRDIVVSRAVEAVETLLEAAEDRAELADLLLFQWETFAAELKAELTRERQTEWLARDLCGRCGGGRAECACNPWTPAGRAAQL